MDDEVAYQVQILVNSSNSQFDPKCMDIIDPQY